MTGDKGSGQSKGIVSFNPVPDVHCFSDSVAYVSPEKSEPVRSNKSLCNPPPSFGLFYANITSLSPQTKNYIANFSPSIKALALVEVHKEEETVNSFLRSSWFTGKYNPPKPTGNGGTHGGELMAFRSNIHAYDIDCDIIDHIEKYYNAPLCFAARVMCLHTISICFISVYFWCSEGFSERNHVILHQIGMLSKLINLPFLCVGDFNIQFKEFTESEWGDRLQVEFFAPDISTTINSACGHVIDYGFYSKSIRPLFIGCRPICSVPFPHTLDY